MVSFVDGLRDGESGAGNSCRLDEMESRPSFLSYGLLLYSSWECRLVQSRELWACMACMSLNGKSLHLAEEALAAIQEVRQCRV